jgi:hypothetical protein
MRCEDIAIELDAYEAGELEGTTRAGIEQHLQQCTICSLELATIRKENELYRAYASASKDWAAAEPATDQIQLKKNQSLIPRWAWAVAAMLILAAGLSWYFHDLKSAPGIAGSGIPAPPPEAAVPMDEALKDLEQAITSLQRSYAEKKSQLDQNLVQELDRNLAVTRAAIHQCKQALKQDPVNIQAAKFLVLDYQKHINILKQITEGL